MAGAAWSLLLGTATLAEYLFQIDLHIDQAVIRSMAGGTFAGRIGPNVAFCFILTGIVLWWSSRPRKRQNWVGAMSLLSAVVLATGVASVIERFTEFS